MYLIICRRELCSCYHLLLQSLLQARHMEDVVNPAPLWQLQLICHLSNSPDNNVRPIETRLELLSSLLLQCRLPVWLKPKIYQVSHLKLSLYATSFCICFLLIFCRLEVILESPEHVLALLDPIFGSRGLTCPKHSIKKR